MMADPEWPEVYKGSIYERLKDPFVFKGVIMPAFENKEALEEMEDWKMRPDDILAIGWPRTVIHADKSGIAPTDQGSNPLTHIDAMDKSKPRMLCGHLPYQYMPKDVKEGKVKVILQLRNFKDATLSHHLVWKGSEVWNSTDYTLGEWLSDQLKGGVPYGDWIDHTVGWLKHKEELNILILQYEDMIEDMVGTVQKMAKFVGKELCPETVSKIAQECTFKAMKKKPDTFEKLDIVSTPYLRKGIVGDWKNHFTVAQSEEIDDALKERMQGIGDITFKYE
ncbi:unnamed protein product [Owenia fusiformis]|uniref:Sulfotransferase domain-containing protein n=1 Tax=Owenia fusiformis TaxID=6347 RepID=A0A8S4Q5A2_OWEFU|nr:unnamed protein product [Owenia fusiformis]